MGYKDRLIRVIHSTDLVTSAMEMPNILCRIKVIYILLPDFFAFDSSIQYSAASPCPLWNNTFLRPHLDHFVLLLRDISTLRLAYYSPEKTSILNIL